MTGGAKEIFVWCNAAQFTDNSWGQWANGWMQNVANKPDLSITFMLGGPILLSYDANEIAGWIAARDNLYALAASVNFRGIRILPHFNTFGLASSWVNWPANLEPVHRSYETWFRRDLYQRMADFPYWNELLACRAPGDNRVVIDLEWADATYGYQDDVDGLGTPGYEQTPYNPGYPRQHAARAIGGRFNNVDCYHADAPPRAYTEHHNVLGQPIPLFGLYDAMLPLLDKLKSFGVTQILNTDGGWNGWEANYQSLGLPAQWGYGYWYTPAKVIADYSESNGFEKMEGYTQEYDAYVNGIGDANWTWAWSWFDTQLNAITRPDGHRQWYNLYQGTQLVVRHPVNYNDIITQTTNRGLEAKFLTETFAKTSKSWERLSSGGSTAAWVDKTSDEHYGGSNPENPFTFTMVYDPVRKKTVMYSATGTAQFTANAGGATFEWNGTSWAAFTDTRPTPLRHESASVYDPVHSCMILFGGYDSTVTNKLNDTWQRSGTTWTQLFPATVPAVRYGAQMVWDSTRNVGVMFGGLNNVGPLLETWEWRPGPPGNWVLVNTAHRPASHWVAMAYDSYNQVTVAVTDWGDTWTYNGTDWTQVGSGVWTYKIRPAMCYDPVRKVIVLYGGSSYFNGGQQQLWANDTWELTKSGSTWSWTKLPLQGARAHPYVRAVYDTDRSTVVLIGSTSLDDFWSDTWFSKGGWTSPAYPVRDLSETILPNTYDFGSVQVGEYADTTFTVTNTGTDELYGTVTASAGFSVVGTNTYRLAGGAHADFTVRFTPTESVPYSGTVTFSDYLGVTPKALSGIGTATQTGRKMSLTEFIQPDFQNPIGVLTSAGLTSSMRNPLYDSFGNSKIILDVRGRDGVLNSGWNIGYNTNWITDHRRHTQLEVGFWSMGWSLVMTQYGSYYWKQTDNGYTANVVMQSAQGFTFTPSYNGATWTWTQITPTHFPGPRSHTAMVYDSARSVTVLFGGWDINYYNDTWQWNGTDWTQITTAHAPSVRRDMGMSYHNQTSNQYSLVFGGWNGTALLSDTWKFNGTDWTQLSPAHAPSARKMCRMAYFASQNVTILFGGYNGTALGDTWAWNGTDWTQLSPTGTPTAVYGHAMAYDSTNNRILLFGGRKADGSASAETWKLEYTGGAWVWTKLNPGTVPIAFTGMNMAFDPVHNLFLMHGDNIQSYYAYSYNNSDSNWHQFQPPANAGYYGAMAFDAAHGNFVIAGGSISYGYYEADVWDRGLGLYGCDANTRVVMLMACKVKSLSREQAKPHTKLGYWSTSDGYDKFLFCPVQRCNYQAHDDRCSYRLMMQSALTTGSTSYQGVTQNDTWSRDTIANVPLPGTDLLNSNSLDKWMLCEIVKGKNTTNENDVTVRVLGTQFQSSGSPISKVLAGDAGYSFSVPFMPAIPFHPDLEVGFFTVAQYKGDLPNGKKGTESDAIEWKLFDDVQTLKTVEIEGDTITFTCSGQVAFEVYTASGWTSTGYYDTGTHTVQTARFSAIRPLLKNTGLMNADNVAVLNAVEVTMAGPTNLAANVNGNLAALTITSLAGAVRTEWAFTGDETFTVYTGRDPTVLPRIHDQGVDHLNIDLIPGGHYRVKVRQTVDA